MSNQMAIHTYLHGKGLPTAFIRAGKRPLLLMEGADVALQVEDCGEGPLAPCPRTNQHLSLVRVDALVLL